MRLGVLLFLALAAVPSSVRAADCVEEEALSEAAALLALQGPPLTSEKLIAALRDAGSDLLSVRAASFGPEGSRSPESYLAAARARADGTLVCGEAMGPAGRLLLVASRGGRLEIDLAHRSVEVELAPGFEAPELVVRDAGGTHHRFPLEAARFELPPHVALPAVVQLVARGSTGPRPVAERTMGDSTDGGAPARLAAEEADLVLGERIGALRGLHDARPLRPNRLLAKEAELHATRVCKEGRVGHELAGGETPVARLARRGVRARVVGETIARASDSSAALSAMAKSPSHLVTLIDRRFTDAGWGVATDPDGQSCLVVLLAAWPRMVPTGLPKTNAAEN